MTDLERFMAAQAEINQKHEEALKEVYKILIALEARIDLLEKKDG